MYALLFGRSPDAAELGLAMDYLAKPDDGGGQPRWERYAQALMATSEAMYVD
jgi:hypothetical protein